MQSKYLKLFRDRVSKELADVGQKTPYISSITGIDRSTLYKALRDSGNPGLLTIAQIAETFDLKPANLLVDERMSDLLRLFDQADGDGKQAILDHAKSISGPLPPKTFKRSKAK